jgi:lysophospholipase L1-like esterase
MSTKQIQIWYGILIGTFLLVGLLLLGISIYSKHLGFESSESWGLGRISIALLGSILGIISVSLLLPRIKIIVQTLRVAELTRYVAKSTTWIVVAFGLCELILQATISRLPEMNYEEGWGAVPVSGTMRFWGEEGYGITHYLAHGEIATPFDDGITSIVVLGDSHTEAFHVSDDNKFISVAEIIIRSNGKVINLHNFGKSGNSIADYIYIAPLVKQYYSPEVVIIQINTNDGKDAFNAEKRNYFIVNASSDLELHHNEKRYNEFYNKFRSVIFSIGKKRYSLLKNKTDISAHLHPVKIKDSNTRMDDQLRLLKEAYLGTRVILLLLPYTPNIDKDKLNFNDGEYITLLENVEESGDFFIINPRSDFEQLVESGYLPRGFKNSLPGEGHLNIYGHRIIGELLAEKILEIAQ